MAGMSGFGAVALGAVLQHCDDVYLLSGEERYRFTFVCRACLSSVPAKAHFVGWLVREEKIAFKYNSGAGFQWWPMRLIYYEYHAARLQRLFLRCIQQSTEVTVIAGSFPASRYLEKWHSCSWRPHDIDVFVFSRARLDAVLDCYSKNVADALGLSLRIEKYQGYDDGDDLETGRPPRNISRSERAVEIGEWLRDSGDWIPLDVRKELAATAEHLPVRSRPQTYRVLESVRVTLTVALEDKPAVILPLNIVVVEQRWPEEAYVSPAALICHGFDLTLVCVSLTLTDTGHYEFEDFNGGFVALVMKRVVLRPSAFYGSRDCCAEMSRLVKYFGRGFRW